MEPKCHRRRIRKQANRGGIKRREAQPCEHGASDRHGRAESPSAFHERAKGKSDQQRLQPPIASQVS